jgi:uncharacterized protein (TIGR00730 family)
MAKKFEEHFPLKKRSWLAEIARIMRFMSQYIRGIFIFSKVGRCVTVFGSHRITSGPYYELGEKIGAALAKAGFAVMTGGGPGLMQAANQGASQANGQSCGCAITIPGEQSVNPYVHHSMVFRYFFMRKIMLTHFSVGFVALPGGFGTLDELFEMLTLIVTKRIASFPVVLLGTDFWAPLMRYLKKDLVKAGTLVASELSMVCVTDDIDEAIAFLHRYVNQVKK